MSAFPPTPDIERTSQQVRYVPNNGSQTAHSIIMPAAAPVVIQFRAQVRSERKLVTVFCGCVAGEHFSCSA